MDQERSLVFSVLNALQWSEFIDFSVNSRDILNKLILKMLSELFW